MDADQKTLIVVPCYNEANRLDPAAFLGAIEQRPWLHLGFVDDGSTDETARVLEALKREAPSRIDYQSLPHNAGKAEAVRRGVLDALDTDAKLIGYWDADLATPLEELDGMRAALLRHDAFLVLGSRVRLLGRHIRRKTSRHMLGRLFATVASAALGLPVYDTQCGAKLFRANDVARALFADPFSVQWVFDVEMLARLMTYNRRSATSPNQAKIIEFPLTRWEDVAGSKVRARDFVRAALDLGKVVATVRRQGRRH